MKKTILLFCMAFVLAKTTTAQKMNEDSTLTLKNLYCEILKDSIQFPEIVFTQAIAETGWLTSKACKSRNNLFGLKNGVSRYATWQDCVKAYEEKIQSRYKGGDYEAFLIKIGYAANGKEYIKFLHQIQKTKRYKDFMKSMKE